MGIDRKIASLLIAEGKKRRYAGSVLQLGKQDITISWTTLKKLCRIAASVHDEPKASPVNSNPFVSDIDFFRYLGFSEVHSLDNSDFEGADIIFDMNSRNVPDYTKNRYDAIFDGGTMEHVFDCPQFLRNVCEMLRIGGRVIHLSPIFNHINHGFYFFSPTLFMDYYEANRFNLQTLLVIKVSSSGVYACDCLDRKTYSMISRLGGFKGGYYAYVVACKTAASRSDVIPQQGLYVSSWAHKQEERQACAPGYRHRMLRRIKALSQKNFVYFRAIAYFRDRFLASWFYRKHVDRALQWKKLPT